MNTEELNGTQTAVLFGAVCLATAVAVGLTFKAIVNRRNKNEELWIAPASPTLLGNLEQSLSYHK